MSVSMKSFNMWLIYLDAVSTDTAVEFLRIYPRAYIFMWRIWRVMKINIHTHKIYTHISIYLWMLLYIYKWFVWGDLYISPPLEMKSTPPNTLTQSNTKNIRVLCTRRAWRRKRNTHWKRIDKRVRGKNVRVWRKQLSICYGCWQLYNQNKNEDISNWHIESLKTNTLTLGLCFALLAELRSRTSPLPYS